MSPSTISSFARARASRTNERETLSAIERVRALTGAGMPPGDALRFGAAVGGAAASKLAHAARLVERGQCLSLAMQRSGIGLQEADLALLRAGERSGDISAALTLLCQRLTQRGTARRQILRTLAYPCALLVVTILVVLAMTTLVLPSFVALYANANTRVPATTRALMATGAWVVSYGPHFVLATVAAVLTLQAARRANPGIARSIDRLLLVFPFYGTMLRARERAEFYATAACLLRAGVDVETALDSSAATVANRAIRAMVETALRSLRRGAKLSEALARSGLDDDRRDATLFRVAEAIGDYAGTCERIAKLENESHDVVLQRISRIIEPAVLLIMAAAVSAAAMAVYQPVLGSAALLIGGSP